MAGMTVKEICKLLDLQPHQEGGFFKETFRDSDIVLSTDSLPPRYKVARPVSTAIYFLLPTGAVSRLHRIPCAEVWHFYASEPLTVSLFWHPNSMSFFHNQLQPIFLGKMEVPSCRFNVESWLFSFFFHQDFCALCLSFFLVFTSHEYDSLFLQL
jgi:hypothetical protein